MPNNRLLICKLCTSVWWPGLRYICNRMQHHVLQDIALNKKKQRHSHRRFVAYKIQQEEWQLIKQICKLGYMVRWKAEIFYCQYMILQIFQQHKSILFSQSFLMCIKKSSCLSWRSPFGLPCFCFVFLLCTRSYQTEKKVTNTSHQGCVSWESPYERLAENWLRLLFQFAASCWSNSERC